MQGSRNIDILMHIRDYCAEINHTNEYCCQIITEHKALEQRCSEDPKMS